MGTRTRTAFITGLAAEISALLIFGVSAAFTLTNSEVNKSAPARAAFIWVLAFVIGARIAGVAAVVSQRARDLERDGIEGKLSDISQALQTHHVVYLGTPSQGMAYTLERLNSDVISIKDTVLRTNGITNYTSDEKVRFDAALTTFLKRGGRYTAIRNQNAPSISPQLQTSSQKITVYEIPTELPIINCIIIESIAGKEVIFGWEYDDEHQGHVFSSSNPHLVDYFSEYFVALAKHTSTKKISTPAAKLEVKA